MSVQATVHQLTLTISFICQNRAGNLACQLHKEMVIDLEWRKLKSKLYRAQEENVSWEEEEDESVKQ